MQIVIDIPEKVYKDTIEFRSLFCEYMGDIRNAIKNSSPLQISTDGTLTITVDDATKIGRVLVQDNKHNGGLFYANSN